jgi:nucleoside-diphosphate-sugar epimerase
MLKRKNVLITGGAGFIGSSLVRKLIEEKNHIIIYDNFSFGSILNLKGLENSVKIVRDDILNYSLLEKVFTDNEIDYVFHLVADPYIPNSFKFPKKVFEAIVHGTKNVLKACEKTYVKRLLFISSAEVYGNYKYLPMDESHPTNPLSAYAKAKLTCEKMISKNKDIDSVILRLFNTYGPRETHPYIIPDLISQFAKSNNIKLGNINSKRCFIFVEDVVNGIVKLIKCNKAVGKIINLGSEKSYSIKELANFIAELMGYNSYRINIEKKRLRPLSLDPKIFECDYSMVKKLIGWRPKVKLESGLIQTIEWFNKNGNEWSWNRI